MSGVHADFVTGVSAGDACGDTMAIHGIPARTLGARSASPRRGPDPMKNRRGDFPHNVRPDRHK